MSKCTGCNVNYPHEHRCHGGNCDCRECDNVIRLLEKAEAQLKMPEDNRWYLEVVTIRKRNCELEAQLDAVRRQSIQLYNQGYGAGHHDTVEGCYTDIHQVDMDTYHDDVVGELLEEAIGEVKS